MRIVYAHGTITPEEVITFLSLSGQADFIFQEIIGMKEVVKKAKELGINVSSEELQQFADSFRVMRGLHSAEETLKFFEDTGISEHDFELFCEVSALTEALKEHLATENKIREYFSNHRAKFDLARISIALAQNENMANEIIIQVIEDGEDFHVLARKFSVDEETKYAGGYIGLITRQTLPPEVEAKVFNATAGDLVGPIRRGDFFQVIFVQEVIRAELDSNVKAAIKERLFQEWESQFLKEGMRIAR